MVFLVASYWLLCEKTQMCLYSSILISVLEFQFCFIFFMFGNSNFSILEFNLSVMYFLFLWSYKTWKGISLESFNTRCCFALGATGGNAVPPHVFPHLRWQLYGQLCPRHSTGTSFHRLPQCSCSPSREKWCLNRESLWQASVWLQCTPGCSLHGAPVTRREARALGIEMLSPLNKVENVVRQ